MALSRAALISAVSSELDGVLTLAGFTSADTAGNCKEPADRTFRALDVAEVDLATATIADGAEEQGIAYLRYFVIEKAVWNTSSKMNVKAGSASANLKEQHDHLKELLGLALAQAQALGLPLPGAGQSAYTPVPYAGGISQSEYDSIAANSDRIPPMFSLDDIAIPGVTSSDWGEWQW